MRGVRESRDQLSTGTEADHLTEAVTHEQTSGDSPHNRLRGETMTADALTANAKPDADNDQSLAGASEAKGLSSR